MIETKLVRQERAVYKQFPFAGSGASRSCSVAIIQKIAEVVASSVSVLTFCRYSSLGTEEQQCFCPFRPPSDLK